MTDLHKLLSTILSNHKNTSDIYLFANYPPIIREFEEIIFLQIPNLSILEVKEAINLLSQKYFEHCQKENSEIDKESNIKDFTFDFDIKHRLRVHIDDNLNQHGIIIHVLRLDITDLNIPKDFYQAINRDSGLILIASPLNNGQTTTIISILSQIENKRILIFDTKCELKIKSDKSLISYCDLISENFIRKKSPDIVFFHDIDNDKKLIEVATNCIQDGLLVITSLNSLSIKSAIAKIAIFFNNNNILHVLSERIIAVMFQVLVKKKDCLGSLAVYDFISFDNEMKNLIKENNIKELSNQNIDNLINDLVEKEVLDYAAAEKVLIKLGYNGLNNSTSNLKHDDVF